MYYIRKFNKQDSSFPKWMVHDREKLKEYLEMSFKNKAKSPVLIGKISVVQCNFIWLFIPVFTFRGLCVV